MEFMYKSHSKINSSPHPDASYHALSLQNIDQTTKGALLPYQLELPNLHRDEIRLRSLVDNGLFTTLILFGCIV